MQRSRRCFHRIGIYRRAATRGNNHRIYGGTFRKCTGNRAEIADISHLGPTLQKRILALLKQERNKILRLLISHGRNESDHTLMILPGDTVDRSTGTR